MGCLYDMYIDLSDRLYIHYTAILYTLVSRKVVMAEYYSVSKEVVLYCVTSGLHMSSITHGSQRNVVSIQENHNV